MFTSNIHNLILNTDSYKASHYLQYPPDTTHISSYVESRGGQYEQVIFFGLQAFIKEYLLKPITQIDIDEAATVFAAHAVPFNQAGWQYVLDSHGGYLPLEIEAVAEGTIMPRQEVLCQVVNTDPNCYWLTSYIETALLRSLWYPTTVASLSYYCKQIIKAGLEKSADTLDNLPFKLHDFGARGASSLETAALGGLAHLVNFTGTDTVVALSAASRWYQMGEDMPAFSVPAAEHSTMTSWGREHEADAYANMLTQFGQDGAIISVVSDSYDLWHAIDEIWGNQLKQQIIDSGATLVVRPDSGDPSKIVRECLERLAVKFGTRINDKGYKVLPDYIRLIQGDGISPSSLPETINAILEAGFSLDNVTFGMGGGLLQQLNRDTLNFAMKASAAQINGEWRDVYKDPITSRSKRSKRGRLALIKKNGSFVTVRQHQLADSKAVSNNYLRPVYRDGKLLIDESLTEIRQRTNA